jgi:hypothetical protein
MAHIHEFTYSYVDGQLIFDPRPELSEEINEAAKKLLSAVIVRDGVCYTSSVGPISTIYDGLVKIVLKPN